MFMCVVVCVWPSWSQVKLLTPEPVGWMGQRSQVQWERPLMFSLTTGIKTRTQRLCPPPPPHTTTSLFFFFLKKGGNSQGVKLPLHHVCKSTNWNLCEPNRTAVEEFTKISDFTGADDRWQWTHREHHRPFVLSEIHLRQRRALFIIFCCVKSVPFCVILTARWASLTYISSLNAECWLHVFYPKHVFKHSCIFFMYFFPP